MLMDGWRLVVVSRPEVRRERSHLGVLEQAGKHDMTLSSSQKDVEGTREARPPPSLQAIMFPPRACALGPS